MKVLLVRPRVLNAMTVFAGIVCEPLELEYLAAACREAGTVAVLYDGVFEGRRFERVVRAVQPDVAAITGYLTQEREMRAYARLVKRLAPGCRVVVGGVHAQLNYRRRRRGRSDSSPRRSCFGPSVITSPAGTHCDDF